MRDGFISGIRFHYFGMSMQRNLTCCAVESVGVGNDHASDLIVKLLTIP